MLAKVVKIGAELLVRLYRSCSCSIMPILVSGSAPCLTTMKTVVFYILQDQLPQDLLMRKFIQNLGLLSPFWFALVLLLCFIRISEMLRLCNIQDVHTARGFIFTCPLKRLDVQERFFLNPRRLLGVNSIFFVTDSNFLRYSQWLRWRLLLLFHINVDGLIGLQ